VTVIHSADAYRALGGADAGSFEHPPGVTVRPLETRFPRGAALLTYLSGRPALYARRLESVFAEERFDVVHFHNVSLAGGPGVLRYGDGVKLYTTSEHWLVCPMHVLFRDNREPCVDPHCLRCTLRFGRPPQLWRYTGLLDCAVSHVDLFLSPSRFTLEAHRVRGFTAPMRHLPYFLPEDEVAPGSATAAAGPDRPYFLYVGRLERLKGVQVLIEAFRRYRNADLLVAGEGEYGEELRRRAEALEHVRFLGRVHPSALASLYAGALALLVPSVGYEVFGIVIVEAFAHRTPVIVHDLGALPEVVADSGGGLVYRTPAELVDARARLAGDPALRRELGERGCEAWRLRWSEEPHLEGYFQAIAEARALGS
jgi:glycosyltransferase involved in cell wall biosynthesis